MTKPTLVKTLTVKNVQDTGLLTLGITAITIGIDIIQGSTELESRVFGLCLTALGAGLLMLDKYLSDE